MSYWLPDPLPLPPGTRSLFWHPGPIDRGAAWAMFRQARLRDPELPGDPCTLSGVAWTAFCNVKSDDRHKGWMRRPRRHARKYGVIDIFIDRVPIWEISPRFLILGLPFLSRHYDPLSPEDAAFPFFLVARREGDRVRVYPRSLRSRRQGATPGRLMRRTSFERLEAAWDANFDALPRWATTLEEKRQGLPYIAGTIPAADTYIANPLLAETPLHPFWDKARKTLAAGLALEGMPIAPPPARGSLSNTYHWTVLAQRQGETPTSPYAPFPLTVRLPYDGRGLDPSPDPKDPNISRRLERLERTLARVFERLAPGDPLFFDTLERESRPSGWGDADDNMKFISTGQFFPWMTDRETYGPGSAHEGIRRLAELPEDWRATFLEIWSEEKTRIPA